MAGSTANTAKASAALAALGAIMAVVAAFLIGPALVHAGSGQAQAASAPPAQPAPTKPTAAVAERTSGVVLSPAAGPGGSTVVAAATAPSGWWEATANGGVYSLGGAPFYGSAGSSTLNFPIVGMASTPSGNGYWLVAADGGVFSFGNAAFHGSTGAIRLNSPIVGMASTPSGNGYWLVAADGGVFSFGDAAFHGSTGAIRLNSPIIGMASTPSGGGYWMAAADGGIFSFGDAVFAGAGTGALGSPAAAVVVDGSAGYWLAGAAGQLMAFGGAPRLTSAAGALPARVVGAATAGDEMRLVAADGATAVVGAGQAPVLAAAPAPPAALSPSSNSYTFLSSNGDGSAVRYNPCTAVHYTTNLSEAPAGAAALVTQTFAAISAATGLAFVDDGPTSEEPSANRASYQPARYGNRWAPILVAWSQPSESDLLPGGTTIGEGGSSWIEEGQAPKVYVTGEAVIDSANTGAYPANFGAGSTLGELLLHEVGHVVGLGHTTDATQIMFPTLLPQAATASYGPGDLTGLAHLGVAAGCLSVPAPQS